MLTSHALVGDSHEFLTDGTGPEGYIVMKGRRPEPHYICKVVDGVGVWVEHPPAHPQMSSLDFLQLFGPERRAIKQAAAIDIDIGIWYDDTVAAQFITYADPRVSAGLEALLAAGLLTQARHAEIVAQLQ